MAPQELLEAVREQYPWPVDRPDEAAIPWSIDDVSRGLITDAITRCGGAVDIVERVSRKMMG